MFAYAQDIGWIYEGGPPHLVPAGWNPHEGCGIYGEWDGGYTHVLLLLSVQF